MSEKESIKVCGKCRRIRPRDLSIRWCPFRAVNIHPGKPAERCIMFIGEDGEVNRGRENAEGAEDVR